MRSTLARLDTPLACVLVLVVALSLLTLCRLERADFDPSAFIVAGDHFSDAGAVPPGVSVLPDSDGYDGQFYYRLALDPFTSRATDFGITLDNPPYRHQRILYPLIVHAVALGDAHFVPAAMIAVNFAFFCALAWVAGSLARSSGRHALWGLLIVANPGFLVTYSRDLVEIVEATFMLASVLLVRRDRSRWAAVALTLAVLARETSLIVAVAAAIVFAIDRWRGRRACGFGWPTFAAPILAFSAMQGALWMNWGRLPVRAGGVVMGSLPLTGFTESLSSPSVVTHGVPVGAAVALAFVVLCSAGIAYHWVVTEAEATARLACVFYGLLLTSVGRAVWIEDIAFLRVFTQFYVFGAILVMASRPGPVRRWFAIVVGATWTFEFVRFAAMPAIVEFLRGAT